MICRAACTHIYGNNVIYACYHGHNNDNRQNEICDFNWLALGLHTFFVHIRTGWKESAQTLFNHCPGRTHMIKIVNQKVLSNVKLLELQNLFYNILQKLIFKVKMPFLLRPLVFR